MIDHSAKFNNKPPVAAQAHTDIINLTHAKQLYDKGEYKRALRDVMGTLDIKFEDCIKVKKTPEGDEFSVNPECFCFYEFGEKRPIEVLVPCDPVASPKQTEEKGLQALGGVLLDPMGFAEKYRQKNNSDLQVCRYSVRNKDGHRAQTVFIPFVTRCRPKDTASDFVDGIHGRKDYYCRGSFSGYIHIQRSFKLDM